MGMLGPLTAQALGRSPYDDVVEGEGEEDRRQPAQQYDIRGRPINPETRRMNRDIVRSHNEVMLVIGVAEAENPLSTLEVESKRRHEDYEEEIGLGLLSSAQHCVEAVGVFGVNGLRQRILCLGLAKSSLLLPSPKFFIPFTDESPIPAPPLPEDFTVPSILRWAGDLSMSAAPFLVWAMTRRMGRDWRLQIWDQMFKRLPSTSFLGKKTTLTPATLSSPLPPPPSTAPHNLNNVVELANWEEPPGVQYGRSLLTEPGYTPTTEPESTNQDDPTSRHDVTVQVDSTTQVDSTEQPSPVEAIRRPSIFSTRGDDYATDDDENEGVTATLISFDVEATESNEAPAGLWSAELRPSAAPDTRPNSSITPEYLDTLLTRLPALVGVQLFTNAALRILMVPYEATALRLVSRTWLLRQGIGCDAMRCANLFSGLSLTSVVNLIGCEMLHLVLCGEVWALFTAISDWFHMTEDEWKAEEEAKD
ncbi:hypothetical protein DCS_02688 [Drechmeria coniospora]|uniref:Uncharacterized protein n=1 Tax=Drechmeria coniospora TaxID=98403 RepID=A0A151GWR7_DRECN|nr:hypothetical protein DCS_02688 [Drechmeria coniospora]KYK61546.1 hypothetical protein DCS_02688 [Drechmeria coniospora]